MTDDNGYEESPKVVNEIYKRKVRLPWLIGIAVVCVLLPLCIVTVLIFWITETSFRTIEEIPVNEIAEIRLQLLNRPDGKDDIGPILLGKDDFLKILQPLANAKKVQELPGMPWLGEYQIRFQDGRRGTIRLRWQHEDPKNRRSPAIVWFKIGTNCFRGPTLDDLLLVAEDCASRGQKP